MGPPASARPDRPEAAGEFLRLMTRPPPLFGGLGGRLVVVGEEADREDGDWRFRKDLRLLSCGWMAWKNGQ